MIAMKQIMLGRGLSMNPFAKWYPRWGTNDIVLALNGVFNIGVENEHDSNSQTWTDLVNGINFTRATNANGYAKWGNNRLEFDSIRRLLTGTIPQLSATGGFTLEAFGYWATNWGVAIQTFPITGSQQISEVMPRASNIGVGINVNSVVDFIYPSAPSTTDVCLTCDSDGNVVIYADGIREKTYSGGSSTIERVRGTRRIYIGGIKSAIYPPSNSALYGVTIYQDALSDTEVASLYSANVANFLGSV